MIKFDKDYVMTINGAAATSPDTQPVFNPANKMLRANT